MSPESNKSPSPESRQRRPRGRPPSPNPRLRGPRLFLNRTETLALELGRRAVRTDKHPNGIPDNAYARIFTLYGRVRPKVLERVLLSSGFGTLLPDRMPAERSALDALDDDTP